ANLVAIEPALVSLEFHLECKTSTCGDFCRRPANRKAATIVGFSGYRGFRWSMGSRLAFARDADRKGIGVAAVTDISKVQRDVAGFETVKDLAWPVLLKLNSSVETVMLLL